LTVVPTPQPLLQLADRSVERGVEVGPAGFGAYGPARGATCDRNVLACLGLAGVVLVVQLDLVADDVAIVSLQASEFLGDVRSVEVGRFDIVTGHNNCRFGVHSGLPGVVGVVLRLRAGIGCLGCRTFDAPQLNLDLGQQRADFGGKTLEIRATIRVRE
jgi:hypothetical protein